MKKTIINPIFTIALFFLNFSFAIAQETLKKDEIEKYLRSMPQIQHLAETSQNNNSEDQNVNAVIDEESSLSMTPLTDSLGKIKNLPNYEDFLKIIKNAGFNNPEEWASVGDRVMMAYSAFQLKNPKNKASPDLNELKVTLQDELQNIEKNQFISIEQKQHLINKLQKSIALLNDPNYINSQNIPVIAPYIERLNSILRNTNDTY